MKRLAAAAVLLLLTACTDTDSLRIPTDPGGPSDASDAAGDPEPSPDVPTDLGRPDLDAAGDPDLADLNAVEVSDTSDASDLDASDLGDAAPVECLTDGVLGECLPTAECDGMSTPGFCPGPADIQCCTPEVVVDCTVMGVPGACLDVSECTGDRAPTPGFCPGPANIQCCTPVDGEACDPSAMPQPNAGLDEEAGVGGCPDGMVPVADFCIDRYEAALVEVLEGGTTQPWSPYHNPGTRRVRAVSLPGAVPQGYITGNQAAAACDEAGKRLCDDDEWLRACRGSAGANDYPYGPSQIDGWCNENRPVHPVIEYFGTSADWIWSQLGNACINQLPSSLAETGVFDQCVSVDGVYDLVGNLHEWTADPTGIFRGGYYVDTWRNGTGCNYRTTAHNREHWDYSTGFRCCD